jgi:hypothetical protein
MAFLPIRPRPVGGLEVLGDELGDERMNWLVIRCYVKYGLLGFKNLFLQSDL